MRFNSLVESILEAVTLPPPPPAYVQQVDISERDKDILATLLVKRQEVRQIILQAWLQS